VVCYLQSTTEENLYLCVINKAWGAKTNKLSHWLPRDIVIVYVDRALAALFEVSGMPFYDETPIWPGDIYPYRVPIELHKIVHPGYRYSISNLDTREVLFRHHSTAYGVSVVLTAKPLHEEPADLLLEHLEQSPAWEPFDPLGMLEAVREQLSVEQEFIDQEVVEARPIDEQQADEYSPHTQMQLYLAQLGRSLHFDIWIPKADQGLFYRGVRLGELSEPELPALPFNNKVIQIIGNIDVIWFQDGHPTHLFEVEHTTSVYSGLLRMSDLITLIPSLDIRMYICADEERKNKVRAEVARPTFSRKPTPLVERCRFIPFRQLAEFMEEQHKYLRHFNISILDDLSDSLEI
jgi:hypothetical protein